MNLSLRERLPEQMDDPALPEAAHRAALVGLARLNAIRPPAASFWPIIADLARRHGRRLAVLDLGCAKGDLLLALARRAQAARIEIDWHGGDVSVMALSLARAQAKSAGLPIEFHIVDATSGLWPVTVDIVLHSLLLHHLADEQVVPFLRTCRAYARLAVLVNDLERSRWNYAAVWLAARVLTRSAVVHTDGPLSVRAAFTRAEFTAMALAAGWPTVSVRRLWPTRYLAIGAGFEAEPTD